jgi:hypothetical protein
MLEKIRRPRHYRRWLPYHFLLACRVGIRSDLGTVGDLPVRSTKGTSQNNIGSSVRTYLERQAASWNAGYLIGDAEFLCFRLVVVDVESGEIPYG